MDEIDRYYMHQPSSGACVERIVNEPDDSIETRYGSLTLSLNSTARDAFHRDRDEILDMHGKPSMELNHVTFRFSKGMWDETRYISPMIWFIGRSDLAYDRIVYSPKIGFSRFHSRGFRKGRLQFQHIVITKLTEVWDGTTLLSRRFNGFDCTVNDTGNFNSQKFNLWLMEHTEHGVNPFNTLLFDDVIDEMAFLQEFGTR